MLALATALTAAGQKRYYGSQAIRQRNREKQLVLHSKRNRRRWSIIFLQQIQSGKHGRRRGLLNAVLSCAGSAW